MSSSTNQIVYTNKITTFKLEVDIPAGTLVNGESYTAEVIVFDRLDVPSPASDKVVFMTLAKPNFGFANITNNQIITSSSYLALINYEQENGELLNDFQVILYDLNNNVVNENEVFYAINGLQYQLKSLLDNFGYYIEMIGTTVSGMQLRSEKIFFSVEYLQPSMYAKVILENVASSASVKIQSNLIMIDGQANHDPVTYIDDEKIDLTEDGKYVVFDAGFKIHNDFIAVVNCENAPTNTDFFIISDSSGKHRMSIQKNFGYFYGSKDIQEFFTLTSSVGVLSYRITSELISPLQPSEQVSIVIKRIGNYYSISAERSS